MLVFIGLIAIIDVSPQKSQAAIFSSPVFSASRSASQFNFNSSTSVPNQIIVKYKNGDSPDELQNLIHQRQLNNQQSIINHTATIISDLANKLSGNETPEERLNDLNLIDSKAGVTANTRIFSNNNQKANKFGLNNIHRIRTNGKLGIDELLSIYKALPEVEYAQKDNFVHALYVPNDPEYSGQWNLPQIQASSAWDISTGTAQIKVAVIDTGVDYTHEDLPTNIIKGYNYIDDNYLPMDDNGHGSHVAGIIDAVTDNSIGISSVAQNVELIAEKVLDSSGAGADSDVAAGIVEAVNNGANVINLSLGSSSDCTQIDQDAVDFAYANNVTVVAAIGESGTGGVSFDDNPTSPAICQHVISVAAVGPTDQRAYYSDYGNNVDTAAPGGDDSLCSDPYLSCMILSTIPDDLVGPLNGYSYALMEGTSMATAHVSGLAALILSRNNTLTPDQVEALIEDNADTISTDYPIGKRIDAYASLLATPLRKPSLTIDVIPDTSTTVSWSIPEATTSARVDYGWDTSYNFTTGDLDTSPMLYDHTISLPPFAPCQTLYIRAESKDFWGIETTSDDYQVTTSGCTVSDPVIASNSAEIATASGGIVSLLDAGTGIDITAPTDFATGDADFQIKQMDATTALATTSVPTDYVSVGNYFYELKAFSDVSTGVSDFLNPIDVKISYSPSDISGIDESSLGIFRWDGANWTQLTGCVVDTSAHTVDCSTSNFSDFSLFGSESSPVPTPEVQSESSAPESGVPGPVSCTMPIPSAPSLFQIWAQNGQATVYFVPTQSPSTGYTISYGVYDNAEMYNVSFDYSDKSGAIPYTINYLNSNTRYYFKVRANNSCMTGEWSNILSITIPTSSNTKGSYSYKPEQTNSSGSCSFYTVKPGDSLWSIAQGLLGNGAKYLKIILANIGNYPSLNDSTIIHPNWNLSVGC